MVILLLMLLKHLLFPSKKGICGYGKGKGNAGIKSMVFRNTLI